MPSLTLLGQAIVSGLLAGGIYGLLALGLSLSWGLLRLVNLAHFALALLGAYLTYQLGTALHVPPWLAAQQGRLPPLDVVRARFMIAPSLVEAFDTNPVAAMPSLHLAFPVACAYLAWQSLGKYAGVALAAYSIILAWAVMYLGDHYFVDVLAGGALGWVVVRLVARAVLDHAYADVALLDRVPARRTRRPLVRRGGHPAPIGRHEGHVLDAHGVLLFSMLRLGGSGLALCISGNEPGNAQRKT